MSKDEIIKTLLIKYGAIELSRNYIRGIRSALSNIRNGIETNNFALTSKDVGLLAENLANLELIFNVKEGREGIASLNNQKK